MRFPVSPAFRIPVLLFGIALLVAAGLFCLSIVIARSIEAQHPPLGRFVQGGDVLFHVVEEGGDDRPAVVLVHGASGNAAEIWHPLRPVLSDYRVIAFDRPGHGYSSRPAAAWDIRFPSGQAARLVALLDALGIERAVLVGHSWGAALALAAAIAAPERVAGLVLASPASHPWYAGDISGAARLVSRWVIGPLVAHTAVPTLGSILLEPAVMGVFAPDPVPENYVRASRVALVLRPKHFQANAADLIGFKSFLTWQATQYPLVRAPTVILTGEADGVVKPEIHARALARQIPGAELRSFPGRGHMIPYVEAAAVRRAVEDVLERRENDAQ